MKTYNQKLIVFHQINQGSAQLCIHLGDMVNPVPELPSYIDANLSVEYFYSPLFSAFLNINNITNSKYSKWHNYPTQGINIMGGFSYRF